MNRTLRRALTLLVLGAASAAPSAAQTDGSPSWVSVLSADYFFFDTHDIAVGPDGPVIVGGAEDELRVSDGTASGSIFDLGPDASSGGELSFVYGADPSGAPRWVQRAATEAAPFETYHVAAEDDLVVTGEGVLFQPHPYRWTTGTTRISARSATDGSVEWSYDLGALVEDSEGAVQSSAVAYGLEIQNGVVYAAGVFRDTLVVGVDTLVVDGSASGERDRRWFDTFVLALDASSGAPLWARSVSIAAGDRDPFLESVGFDVRGAHAAFGVGDGVFVAGSFPAGASVDGGGDLEAETALIRFGLDGSFERSWTQLDLEVNSDVRDPDDGPSSRTRFEVRPYRLATGPGRPVTIAWSFIRFSNNLGPNSSAYVEAGGRLYRSPESGQGNAGTLVTSHDADGVFGWATALAGNGFPIAWGLDVDRHGRVAVGVDSDSDVFVVRGVRTPREGAGDGFAVVLEDGGRVERLVHFADDVNPSTTGSSRPYQQARAIAFDDGATGTEAPGGSVYVAGKFRNALEVGGRVYRTEEDFKTGVFVARVDLEGAVSSEGDLEAGRLSVSASPNPASSAIRLDVSGARGSVAVRVFDVLGREVAALEGAGGLLEVDVSALPAGAYVVRVEDGASAATKTITVAR
ncbi:T9SS type A sorting domain-containing protein [Rubrivirga sp.]|uniref:T9SS type A sorting domain-containing protein n=1 Tax=Rubrivirga sp. TaxID=1885344 RepID=UPI003C722833